ncbi:MAG: DUF4258 domain-containing protein [Deltaproteobacteria bacterium]|nr:DUF4258 domain-containing protein [Deltaproteobacteria bacterium]
MDIDRIRKSVEKKRIEWQRHALERMLQRGISTTIVKEVLSSGEIIEMYPDDKPLPSGLFLGWIAKKPFHVVAAYDANSDCVFVITAYRPDLEHFKADYKTRRLR